MSKLYQIDKKSVLVKVWSFLRSGQARIFVITCGYYASLFFSTSNRTLLLLSCIYLLVLYWFTKNIKLSLFLAFVATLPFAKGKGYQIFLMAKEDVELRQLYDLVYYFPLYLSGVFLPLLGYLHLKSKITKANILKLPPGLLPVIGVFSVFIAASQIASLYSDFPLVIILSGIQLIILLFILVLPSLLQIRKNLLSTATISVLCATLLFQSSWAILQQINGAPLGKDIEVSLPNGAYGIVATEDASFLRSTGTFFEPSILGTFLLMASVMMLAAGLGRKKEQLPRYLLLFSAVLGFSAIILTGSRMLYILSTIVLLLLLRSHIAKNAEIFVQFLQRNSWKMAIIGISFFVLLSPTIIKRFHSFGEVFSQYGSATYRVQLAKAAVEITKNHPFGRGLNLSHYYFAQNFTQDDYIFDPAYPHNIFFQVLAETGPIGLTLFLLFVYLLVRRISFKNALRSKFYLGSVCFLLAAQFYPIFLSHSEILTYFFLFSGLSMYLEENSTHD